MGRSKAEITLGDQTMLRLQIRRLLRVCGRVAAVGVPLAREAHAALDDTVSIPDPIPGRGPLGGVFAGLMASQTEWNIFLGCDLPFVSPRLLHYLSREALAGNAEAVIPESRDGRRQPLCAAYRRSALYAARSRLERGENRMSRFCAALRCQVISWPELAKAGFAARVFDNMNTPQDYEAARKRLDFPGPSSLLAGT